MKEFVVYLGAALADHPEEVSVLESDGENGALSLELTVADADLNRIIGKQGRTIKAMRTLLTAAAAKSGRRAFLKLKGGEPLKAKAETTPETAGPDQAGQEPLPNEEPHD